MTGINIAECILILLCLPLGWSDEKIICEGDRDTISCGAGEILDILYASYGRSSPTLCPYHNTTAMTNINCNSTVDILAIVEGVCQAQSSVSSCKLAPNYHLFQDDPCYGTYKYLTVGYICQTDEKIICEGDRDTISCGAGEILDILYASYGRSSPTLCPYHNATAMTNINCNSTVDILAIVKGVCHAQSSVSSCKLAPTWILFQGDPCYGTYKYLTVGYICQRGAQPDPCTNYQDINEPLRSVGYIAKDVGYDHLICDRQLAEGWYKFSSGAGGQMPTTCQDLYHCGTHTPLWMDGIHPSVADDIVTRNVCGKAPQSGCCFYKDTIQVKNCGTFYVYKLKPVRGCSIGYCAGSRVTCPPDKWSPTGFEPGCKDAYPKMINSPTLSNPIVKPYTFEFNCHINFDPARTDVGFDITWLFDGHPDRNVPVSHITGADRDVRIDQKYLTGHLGEELTCRADSYFLQSPGRRSPYIPSNGYWMGIKMSESRLVVGEHEKPKEVKLISTIPIVCDKTSASTCHLEVYLEPNNHDFKTTTSCTVTLLPKDWNPTTNQAVVKFEVLAERDFKHDRDKNLVLHFSRVFSVDSPPVFNNYQIPYLQVLTKDKPTAMCSCIGDPHCTTLDHSPSHSPDLNIAHLWHTQRRYMYDYFKVGEFVMYKAKQRPFEVQARTWQCGRAVCNCAIVAREGNDIISIDICHGSYGHTFPKMTILNKGSFSQGTVIQKDRAGNKWVISFPSGATVTVTNSAGKFLNVFISAPEDDYQNTEGLCGTFDGRRDNDQTARNGHVYHWSRNGNQFAESWRVPIGTSMFDKPPQPDPKYNNDMYYCNCNQAKKQVDCRLDGKASRPALHTRCPGCQVVIPQKPVHTGRRRQTVSSSNDDDEAVNYLFDYGLLWNAPPIRDFPTPSGITEENATKLCTDAMHRSNTIGQCVSQASLNFFNEIGSCIEDIKLTDDLTFINSAVEAGIMSCQEYILKNLTFYNNNTGEPPSFITTDICPSDCSGHGTCVQGTCHCDSGYIGDACVIDSRKPPVLYSILGTSHLNKQSDICDVQQRPCKKVYVVGDNIREQSTMQCHMKELQFDNGFFVATGRTFVTPSDYETMHNVLCHMPTKSQLQGKIINGYNISLTNDGQTYSNEIQAFIIDSQCLSCSQNGGQCSIKANTCLIDGVCRKANETKPGNSTLYCIPQTANNKWTSLFPATHTTVAMHTPTQLSTAQHTNATLKQTVSTNAPVTTASRTTITPISSTTAVGTIPINNTDQQSITHWYFAHLPPAQFGGEAVDRFDIWTLTTSGCPCADNKSRTDCACCDVGACQCPGTNKYMCVQCGHTEKCGNLMPAPDNGIDGYTLFFAECACAFDPTQTNCACCQNNGCPCGEKHRNQCVQCGQPDQCGNKPWIFGPAFPNKR